MNDLEHRCWDCQYLDTSESECRFNPPVIIVYKGESHVRFPTVLRTDWCGKFKQIVLRVGE